MVKFFNSTGSIIYYIAREMRFLNEQLSLIKEKIMGYHKLVTESFFLEYVRTYSRRFKVK